MMLEISDAALDTGFFASHQGDDKEHQEDEEADLRDGSSCAGQGSETEESCNDGDDQKYDGIV
jgi:hypothetical protein